MPWSVTPALPVAEADGTSITPTPATGTTGALLVLAWSSSLYAAPTTPTGWTSGGSVVTFSSQTACGLFYRVGDGTALDAPTVNFAAGTYTRHAVILKITGQAASSLFDTSGTVGSNDATSASTIPTPALTLAQAGEILVAVSVNSGPTTSYTWPATWVEQVDYGTAGALGRPHRFSVATSVVTASGSYSPETVTLQLANSRRGMVVDVFKSDGTGSNLLLFVHHYKQQGWMG